MLKVLLSVVAFSVSFLIPHDATATQAAKLTDVSVKRGPSGVAIDLLFDRPFLAKSLKPAFERDFVQLAMRPAKLDAARIVPVAESQVQKIFAYPYNLDTARLRIILKSDSAWARGRVSLWNNNPKSVRIFVKEPQPARLAESARKPSADARALPIERKPALPIVAAPAPAAVAPPPAPAPAPVEEEKKLIAEVVSNTRDIDINNPDSVKAALAPAHPPVSAVDKSDKAEAPPAAHPAESGPIGISADPSRHFARMAIALFGVLALFIATAFGVKKYAGRLKKLPFGKKERLIQVVATHYLGNKKSISLVKITGEYMVVGVSNDGISLISKLGPEVNVDKYLEDRFWGGTFEKHLDHYATDSKVAKDIDLSDQSAGRIGIGNDADKKFGYDGVRDLAETAATVQDKVKLSPSPVRASIKEKLTKLKPLA